MSYFDRVSNEYVNKALVQQRAASKLLKLLEVSATDSVIDIACGPGYLTGAFRSMTGGEVVGTDISPGMIVKARAQYPGIEFSCLAAEDLDYVERFDIAFCNSAMMWFTQPERAIRAIGRALKPGGKLGVANPATTEWSPWMLRVVSSVVARPDIRPIFRTWNDPWFYLPRECDYRFLFEGCGLATGYLRVEHEATEYAVEEAFNIYLNSPDGSLQTENGREDSRYGSKNRAGN